MKFSVFTPMNQSGNPYIAEAYASLCAQSHANWEWVLVLNGPSVHLPPEITGDARVRFSWTVLQPEADGKFKVGALKKEACDLCEGDVLLELDHDDILSPDALERVVWAINAGAGFVYSDFAEFKNGSFGSNPFSADYGWQGYSVRMPHPNELHAVIAMRASTDPRAWRRIEWAPNHLRAWRTSVYRELGGHDVSLQFADDHDLVLRTYLAGVPCAHLAECLYFYRVHPAQNTSTRNAEIQALEGAVYDKYIYRLAEKIADERTLTKLDLCGGIDSPEHYTPIDVEVTRTDGITADLNEPWPLADNTVGVIRAFDALEHLREPMHAMNEAWRVLAPGGFLLVMVPSTDSIVYNEPTGRKVRVALATQTGAQLDEVVDETRAVIVNGSGAYCDPTHVSFWNEKSFRYYVDKQYQRYLRGLKARFQVARLRTINRNGVPYVQAELIALKPGYEPMGEVRC